MKVLRFSSHFIRMRSSTVTLLALMLLGGSSEAGQFYPAQQAAGSRMQSYGPMYSGGGMPQGAPYATARSQNPQRYGSQSPYARGQVAAPRPQYGAPSRPQYGPNPTGAYNMQVAAPQAPALPQRPRQQGGPTQLNPNDPLQQALSLHQAGRYADAVALYESVILKTSPDPRLYASIADAHLQLGNVKRAFKYAVESLKLDPNYSSGHLMLGSILEKMGDYRRAIRSYEKVITLDRNNPYAYYNLGLVYYDRANMVKALQYLRKAKDLNPNDPKIWNNLGVALYDQGELHQAAQAYMQALRLDPQYGVARKNLNLIEQQLPKENDRSQEKKIVKSSD